MVVLTLALPPSMGFSAKQCSCLSCRIGWSLAWLAASCWVGYGGVIHDAVLLMDLLLMAFR
jgi:hypothetical protein